MSRTAVIELGPAGMAVYPDASLPPEEPLAPGIVFVSVHAWVRTERGYRCHWCDRHTSRPKLAGCLGKPKGERL